MLTDLREEARPAVPAFRAVGPAKSPQYVPLTIPTATPAVQRSRAAAASQQRKAIATWLNDGAVDGVDFRRDILPKLQSLPCA